MSLESAIADLIVALNVNTAALTGNAATVAEEPKKIRKKAEVVTPEVVAPAVPTVDDLRKAAQEFVDLCLERGQDANENDAQKLIKTINARNGTKALSKDTPEDKRAGVIAEFKAATAALKAQPAASSAI